MKNLRSLLRLWSFKGKWQWFHDFDFDPICATIGFFWGILPTNCQEVTLRPQKGTSYRSVHLFLHSLPFFPIPQNPMLCSGPDTPLKVPPAVERSAPQYVVPRVHPTQHPKRHLGRIGHFCTAHGKAPLYFTMGRPFPPKKLPVGWTGSLCPPKSKTQTISSRDVKFFLNIRSSFATIWILVKVQKWPWQCCIVKVTAWNAVWHTVQAIHIIFPAGHWETMHNTSAAASYTT